MTGGEKIAAGLSIKATEGVIKLFFESHIDSLKTVLREKNLTKKISDKNLSTLFKNYLSILHKKCHTVNTIVFPNKEILLESIYEPLQLVERNTYDGNGLDTIKPEDIIHDDLENNIVLIDTAGMGKSTFSKYIILKILQNKLYSRIPIFVELRKVTDNETLFEYIVKELNFNKKEIFTQEMLFQLMENGKFIFFLDGFDEVTEKKAKTLSEQINEISTNFSQNLIVLTSRDQAYIPILSKQITCHFKELTLNQIKSLIIKYDNCVNIDVGSRLIEHKNFKTLNFELFNTPLMVNLLYKSFGYNNTIDDNVVTFYNEMFDALYKGHDLTKAGFSREKLSNLNYENFKLLFNAFCFVSLYENKASFKNRDEVITVIDKAKQLSSIELNSSENFFNDLLSSVPLLTKDGLEFKFMHKTIMEFFSAQFLNYSSDNHSLFKKIKESNLLDTFTKSFEFLYELNKPLYIKEIGQEFLEDFISYYKTIKNKNYSEVFKTILFFGKKSQYVIKISDFKPTNTTKPYHLHLEAIMHQSKNKSSIHIFRNEIPYNYNCNSFFSDLLDNKSYLRHSSLKDKKGTKLIINTLQLDTEYSLLSKKILSLQTSELLCTYLLSTLNISNKLSYINFDKCQKCLDSINNKLDILG